ncbi:helix-turn-helix domain-containing protein [Aquimarina algiphila]|uniref:helix-turn-helix domain-containing protein n=1 Tax=Aquimarina algiphila TaxID=2047982 RepID=UPI003CD0E019
MSKIVNVFKEKSFTQYINELRIQYITEKLKKDSRIRNYTLSTIGEEIGFNNTESFSKAFFKIIGIYPSYFIKRL